MLCQQIDSQVRRAEVIGGKWKFCKEGVSSVHPDVSLWDDVTIPHTWNVADGQSGAGGDEWQNNGYYRGPGCYSKTFVVSAADLKNRLFLRFEAVSQTAEVYVNGQFTGRHAGAFNAFCFEITKFVRPGENTLLVKASNEWTRNIAPLGGDFTVFGGIYRPVWLMVLDQVCVTPLDYASSGVYVKQQKLTPQSATIDVTTKISNGIGKTQKLQLVTSVIDSLNRVVAIKQIPVTIHKGENRSVAQSLDIIRPILWHGLAHPCLYQVKVELVTGKRVLDVVSQKVGLRSFVIDPVKGAFLNGLPYKLHGVNRHQDRKGMGWALTNKQHDEDFRLIREIGANAVRLAHYPHSDYTYRLCDSLGLLVWAEIPLVNNITGTPEFAENAKLQLTEFIRQNYNHPSIIFWSIYNEMGHRKTDDPQQLLTDLNTLAHSEDPGRYTVAAANRIERPEKLIPDVIAFNSYPGWYGGTPDGMGKSLTDWNGSVKYKGIGVSEYGAGASVHQHQQGVTTPPQPNGKWHPEEWQALVHERNYKKISQATYCWGSFVWNMFDFASAGRNEGDTVGINDKGLVTYDRTIRKDAFYFYKANWSDVPFVYLTSRRHTQRDTAQTDVKVYSNCAEVCLRVNDTDYGVIKPQDGICIWKNIPLQSGANTVYAQSIVNGRLITDKCNWFNITKNP